MSDGFDVEALIASAAPRTVTASVCARGDLVNRHAALVMELAAAEAQGGSLSGNPEVRRIADEIVAVEQEQAACTMEFVLHSVSRRAWADCLAQHQPRKGVDHRDYNDETFPPAAVALCCDQLTEDQAKRLSEKLHQGEWDKLWDAVLVLNVMGTPRPKLAAATELARANGNSSISQAPQASQDRPSSAGSGDQ